MSRSSQRAAADRAFSPWPGFPDCPCGCGAQGLKLQVRHDAHLVGCLCPVCRGRRNRAKGRGAQRKMHQALGGTGWSPTHEEAARPYTIELTVMPESKEGGQIPASWSKFLATEWFRRALEQSERAVPSGTAVIPAVVLNGRWLIADLRARQGERVA